MDAAACIGCGACVAACPNGAANLFTGAKIAHLNLLPQGQAERLRRTEAMVETMDEHFGSCTNHGECEAACPKEISHRRHRPDERRLPQGEVQEPQARSPAPERGHAGARPPIALVPGAQYGSAMAIADSKYIALAGDAGDGGAAGRARPHRGAEPDRVRGAPGRRGSGACSSCACTSAASSAVGELGPGLLVVFEGRDAGGKGGAIKRIVERLDPRHYTRVVVRCAEPRREAAPLPVALLPRRARPRRDVRVRPQLVRPRARRARRGVRHRASSGGAPTT